MPARKKGIAFTEIRQQDQGQSHDSPAAHIGLGRVALQPADWAGALVRRASQLDQMLTLIGLVQQHPRSFQETKDRVMGLGAELQATLSMDQGMGR